MKKVTISKLLFTAVVFMFSCFGPRSTSPKNNKNTSNTDEIISNEIQNIIDNDITTLPYQTAEDRAWKLIHTDLDLSFNWDNRTANGTAILTLEPYFYPQNKLKLNAKAMDIHSITFYGQNGNNAGPAPEVVNYSYTDSENIVIQFKEYYLPKNAVKLQITYTANPERKVWNMESNSGVAITADKGLYFINHDLSKPHYSRHLWTQGETHSNSYWFPTLDFPNQKHTHKITLTYPDTMRSISNGKMISSLKVEGTNLKRDVWLMDKPHSVYLTMIALGNWKEIKENNSKLPISYFVDPSYEKYAQSIFKNTPEMIAFFENYTGIAYPWDKFDQIVVREFVSGAMENTTAVIHNERVQDPDFEMENYISHELFHQWFGDYVTCENWSDLTLNESFANYSEYLWREHKYGKSNADDWMFKNKMPLTEQDANKNALVNHHYKKADDQFDDIRYNKGGAILHMLRNEIGDDAFRASMKSYLQNRAFKNASVSHWKLAIEETTGKNMDHFFNSWYFSPGILSIQWNIQTSEKGSVLNISPKTILNSSNKQNYAVSKSCHIEIKVGLSNGKTIDTTIENLPTSVEHHIAIEKGVQIKTLKIDPNHFLLCETKADLESTLGTNELWNQQKCLEILENTYAKTDDEIGKFDLFSQILSLSLSKQNPDIFKKDGLFYKTSFQDKILYGLSCNNIEIFKIHSFLVLVLSKSMTDNTENLFTNKILTQLKEIVLNNNKSIAIRGAALDLILQIPSEIGSQLFSNSDIISLLLNENFEIFKRTFDWIEKEDKLADPEFKRIFKSIQPSDSTQKLAPKAQLLWIKTCINSGAFTENEKITLLNSIVSLPVNIEYKYNFYLEFYGVFNEEIQSTLMRSHWDYLLKINNLQYQNLIKSILKNDWITLQEQYPNPNTIKLESTRQRYYMIKNIFEK